MTVSVMEGFTGEDRYFMHLLPLINITQSGIRDQVWLERLVDLLKEEGRTNCPVFSDEEGYILLVSSIESVFHPILEEILEHRGRSIAYSILAGLDAKDHYQHNRSYRRGSENQALENGLDNSGIKKIHIWSKFEGSKVKQPGLNILEHYT